MKSSGINFKRWRMKQQDTGPSCSDTAMLSFRTSAENRQDSPMEISEFVYWLIDGVKDCIDMLKAGTYNEFVRENLPPQHRTGTICRKDFLNVWLKQEPTSSKTSPPRMLPSS